MADSPVRQGMLERLATGEVLQGDDLAGFNVSQFATDALGLFVDEVSLERVRGHLECDERHHQPYGIVHGGVWCAVVESLASIGAAMQVASDGKVVVGVANSTDFLRAHRVGRVDAEARPVHVGRTQQLWQVVLTRAEDGKVVARGQVRLQNVDGAQLG
jgi:1,4-dihydroxy-2-naphthoyl-CoA hydrolase